MSDPVKPHVPQIPLFDEPTDATQSRAVFSPDNRYRYLLTRQWATGDALTWIMLNPSTADEQVNDPTIRRVISYCKQYSFAGVRILNLFALRSTDPRQLLEVDDPVGPENQDHIAAAINASSRVVLAWGVWGLKPVAHTQVKFVLSRLRKSMMMPFCLGTTKEGCPRHPLYVRGSQPLVPYEHEVM